ncbi:MAG TPA: hypothetical protein DCZ43_05785, partial [candidate division Zixibacteria bacterium]|nr:hypothetical protein [candidate division Zixibacteria bacterium]
AQEFKYNYSPVRGTDIMIMPGKNDPALNDLLGHYGLGIGDKILMDEQNQIVSMQTQRQVGFLSLPVNIDVKSPVQIKIVPENMNSSYAFTSNLGPMVYLWGSPLKVDNNRLNELGLKSTTLFTTSPKSWEIEYTGSTPLGADNSKPSSYAGKLPLAVMVNGEFPDPYANQPAPKWQDEPDSVPSSMQVSSIVKAPGKLLLVGASEIFSDQFIPGGDYQGQRPPHEDLMLKAVEGLTLSEDLLQISSKSVQVRFLKETSPLAKVLWRLFTILLAPAIIIALGVTRMLMRQKRRQIYRAMLEQSGGGY